MKKNKKHQSGFSLVEILIYMALMGIFMTVLLDIFVTTLNIKLGSERTSSLNQDMRFVLQKISYEIANADSVTIPATGSASTTLRLTSPTGTKIFASSSGNLVLTASGATMNLNGPDTTLTEISFQNVSVSGLKPAVKFTFTLNSLIDVYGGNRSQTLNSTVMLR